MKNTIKIRFWEEAPGVQSSSRLIYIPMMIWLAWQTSVGIMSLGWEPGIALAFFSGVAATLTGGRLIQKAMEKKPEQTQTPEQP